MNKLISIISIIAMNIFFVSCKKEIIEKENVIDNIQTKKTNDITCGGTVDTSVVSNGGREVFTKIFDKKGNLIEDSHSQNSKKYRYLYKYNGNGDLIQQIHIDESNAKQVIDYENIYNDSGKLIQSNYFYKNKLFCKKLFNYDDVGNLVQDSIINQDGSYHLNLSGCHLISNKYDITGKYIIETKRIKYHSVDSTKIKFMSKYIYTFNNGKRNNVKEESITLDINGDIEDSQTIIYNKNGNIEQQEDFHESKRVIKDYIYNKNGDLAVTYSSDIGGLKSCIDYKYDINGKVIEKESYSVLNGKKKPFSRTVINYDIKGNKSKIISYNGSNIIYDIKRFYYDLNGKIIKIKTYDEYEKLTSETEYKYNTSMKYIKPIYLDIENPENVYETIFREFCPDGCVRITGVTKHEYIFQ